MKYVVVIAQSAKDDFDRLDGRWRSALKGALQEYLESDPKRVSRSRIKRLRGLRQPQYRLRVDEFRVFYDVNDDEQRVEVLGFVNKSEVPAWLAEHGVSDEDPHDE